MTGPNYDWIIVGGGLCGSALAYELSRYNDAVLLLEANPTAPGATCHSYGGIAYWAGNTELTQQLCREARELHATLSQELDYDTEFQERSLLLTVDTDQDPEAIATRYEGFMIQPQVLNRQEALAQEPLLNPGAIAGALLLPHGHVSPMALIRGYQQAFLRQGGRLHQGRVAEILMRNGQAQGVRVGGEQMEGQHIVLCAGAWTQSLLQQHHISVPCLFTHAELLETEPAPFQLQTLIMPAMQQRFALEAQAQFDACDSSSDSSSDRTTVTQPSSVQPPSILDPGIVQFSDGRCYMGQISRTQAPLDYQPDASQSAQQIRTAVEHILPATTQLQGEWISTRVAFSPDNLPLVGQLPECHNLWIFSGFSSPFVYVPPIARRFAREQHNSHDRDNQGDRRNSAPDPILAALNPARFMGQ